MCIVTAEEMEAARQAWLRVSKTNIFARHNRPGQQVLAYSMSIASKSAAAMILPLPVSRPSGEDALRFIDLSAYPEFFDNMASACKPEYDETMDLMSLGEPSERPASALLLVVHEVGDFEASYVPSMADFTRLDPRFRLPDEVWRAMPDYFDYGFAVFQLRLTLMQNDSEVENDIHPIAFEFPTRDPSRLYFPTVHVHDGAYDDTAGFYHRLYCQRADARSEFKYQRDLLAGLEPSPAKKVDQRDEEGWFTGYPWYSRSTEPASEVMPVERCEGLVDPDQKLHSMKLRGDFPNRDIWLGDSLSS